MKPAPLLTLLLLLTPALAPRLHSAAPPSPPVDAILQAWIKGSGGQSALEKIRSRIINGTIEVAALGATGSFEERAKAPDKRVARTELTGLGTLREGFDGRIAWSSMPGMGLTDKTGTELARAKRDATFLRELRFKELYERLEAKGTDRVGDQLALILEATPKEGGLDRFFFNAKSGLLLRQESTVLTATGDVQVEVLYEDYRQVDAVMIPHRVRLTKPAEIAFTIRVSEVRQNIDIPDREFAKPAN